MLPPIEAMDMPISPGWWPPAIGWLVMGIVVFALICQVLGQILFRMIRRARSVPILSLRTRALAALDELEQREGCSDREAAFRLNEILRAALFDLYGNHADWQPFPPMADVVQDQQQWQQFWQAMAIRYQPDDDRCTQAAGWIATARIWLERLPDEMPAQ